MRIAYDFLVSHPHANTEDIRIELLQYRNQHGERIVQQEKSSAIEMLRQRVRDILDGISTSAQDELSNLSVSVFSSPDRVDLQAIPPEMPKTEELSAVQERSFEEKIKQILLSMKALRHYYPQNAPEEYILQDGIPQHNSSQKVLNAGYEKAWLSYKPDAAFLRAYPNLKNKIYGKNDEVDPQKFSDGAWSMASYEKQSGEAILIIVGKFSRDQGRRSVGTIEIEFKEAQSLQQCVELLKTNPGPVIREIFTCTRGNKLHEFQKLEQATNENGSFLAIDDHRLHFQSYKDLGVLDL